MPVVEEVYDYLEAQGLAGGSTEWGLIRRLLDDGDDQVVVVQEDGGPRSEMPADAGIGDAALGDVGVLITVRGAASDSDASLGKAAAIRSALHGLRGIYLVSGGELYLGVRALTPEPVFAGFDETKRPIHTIGFRFLKAE